MTFFAFLVSSQALHTSNFDCSSTKALFKLWIKGSILSIDILISEKIINFLEQSPGGELARRMRETLKGMEHTLGFRVKVAERTGQSLGSKFPLNTLWDGMKCGRKDCTTCEQGLEELPPCTRMNLLYENICTKCNPGAKGKGELEQVRDDIPTLYVGESSRSVYERSKEHWRGAHKGEAKNHMVKHQIGEHNNDAPQFAMKVVRHFKTALARQVAEAVRIRRRGGEGAILNSKGEFNRCYIPKNVYENENENECVFRKGGWCMTHTKQGRKIVNKKKVWSLKKNGLYGYVVRTSTNYSCMLGNTRVYEPVTSAACGRSDSALGGDSTSVHLGNNINRISGVVNNGAGAKESES